LRRHHGALAYAPATAAPTPGDWRKSNGHGPLDTYSKFIGAGEASLLPLPGIVRGRSEPVKAVCDRRTTAPVKVASERTRKDDLDRTCPDQEMAAIGSRDTSGQGLWHLSVNYGLRPQ
jgi:hypothetical protein